MDIIIIIIFKWIYYVSLLSFSTEAHNVAQCSNRGARDKRDVSNTALTTHDLPNMVSTQ